MYALLGVMCLFAKVNCSSPSMFGHAYESKDKCEAVEGKMIEAIKSVDWLDGGFKCVDDI